MGAIRVVIAIVADNVPAAYLDTCVISGLVRSQLDETEESALLELLKRFDDGSLNLVVSEIAEREIARIPPAHRTPHDDFYNLLSAVPTFRPPALTRLSPLGLPMPDPHWPLWKDLTKVLSDDDANHAYQVISYGFDFLVTVDRRTILRHQEYLRESCHLNALLPSEALKSLEESET